MTDDPTRRRVLRYAGGVAGSVGLVGTASGHDGGHGPADPVIGEAQDATYLVQAVDKFDWEPNHIVVPTGGTVTFLGNIWGHTITSADTLVDAALCRWNNDSEEAPSPGGSGNTSITVNSPSDAYNVTLYAGGGGRSKITYNGPGHYPYWCVPHCGQRMVGKVVVVEP